MQVSVNWWLLDLWGKPERVRPCCSWRTCHRSSWRRQRIGMVHAHSRFSAIACGFNPAAHPIDVVVSNTKIHPRQFDLRCIRLLWTRLPGVAQCLWSVQSYPFGQIASDGEPFMMKLHLYLLFRLVFVRIKIETNIDVWLTKSPDLLTNTLQSENFSSSFVVKYLGRWDFRYFIILKIY